MAITILRVRERGQPLIVSVTEPVETPVLNSDSQDYIDVLESLTRLGFRKGDSREAIDLAIQDNTKTAEELLRIALKNLDNGA